MKGPRERSHLHAAPVACAHCGLAVPEGMLRAGEERQFCCGGCRQGPHLVPDWGAEKIYRGIGCAVDAHIEDLDDPRALEGATEEAPGGRCRTRLYLEGVHCAACVWLVEKLPEALDGVDSVRLNLANAVAEVTWRPEKVKLSAIARALDRLGYSPHVHRAGRARDARRAEDRAALVKLGVAAAGAMNLMFLHGALYAGEASGMASPYETFFRWISLGIALPVLAFSARPFFQTAYAGLKSRFVHIDLPVAIGIAVTFAASAANVVRGSGPVYFDSLAMLVAAILGARQVQRAAQRAALERADSLRGVAFLEFARRLEGDGPLAPAVEVPVAALEPGDRVEVRSGELVPADGVVLFGRSTLDGSVLTGESAPVPVAEGGAVWAGVTNLGARLVVKVEAAGEKTRVGALLGVVEDALARRPAVLRLTDLLARRFVQALLLLAAAALLLALPLGTEAAVERVVALLVVACPCALGLSVPLAVSVGLMRAARAGIFVKDPDALDRLRRVGTVLLDKTGTLTEGKASFSRYVGDEAALELATALEAESSHAVAHALRASLGRRVNVVREVAEVREVAGRGISGVVDGRRVAVGNRAHVAAFAPSVPEDLDAHAEALVADGLSPLWVAVDGLVAGVGGIGDPLRADARAT
ncbi:MAG TPA: HAD-IC family P-type ATPase, partial [Thermoanaerobaculia bacterium]|nr:HAD-IC family P-type ATPase [Thermoanaerobaculia bacterium]